VHWSIIILLAAIAAALALAARRWAVSRKPDASEVRQAQAVALEIIRQNTDALRAVERALENNSETLRRLSLGEKKEE